uniref:Uncharacterized protein n=1 Tax=Chenopodium quinoa TaxID=63459 RepID=A0A803MS04_CHEQI
MSTPRYLQANGQAESSNKTIIKFFKKRLKSPVYPLGKHATPRTSTGQTPFSLVYWCEAVFPSEVRIPTTRYGLMTTVQNNIELSADLDTSEKSREAAYVKMVAQ